MKLHCTTKRTLYESPFVAEYTAYETFTCDNLYSEESTKSFTLLFPMFMHLFKEDNQLFLNQSETQFYRPSKSENMMKMKEFLN